MKGLKINAINYNALGKVYLVGAGPGKDDLITVRGRNILRLADVVIYDYLVNRRILNQARDDAELICSGALAKKGKYSNGKSINQNKINNLIVRKVKQGKNVIRLKSGDPSIFARTQDELRALLSKGIKFEIVPGITAASGAAAYLGILLTDRELSSSCVFVTGRENSLRTESSLDWKALAKNSTLVFYMGVGELRMIVNKLLECGKDKSTPVAIICNATLVNQKTLIGSLSDIFSKAKKNKIQAPAIIIIGEVVKFNREFNWLKNNKRILLTGLSSEKFFLQETQEHLPLIKIKPLKSYNSLDKLIKKISNFDWIIFASRYGVKYFFERLKAVHLDVRSLNKIKIAAVGRSTADNLLKYAIIPDLIPKDESSRGLIKEFKKQNIKGKHIFMPRSDLSGKKLKQALCAMGAKVTSIRAYNNIKTLDLPDLNFDEFNEVRFTSPSTVRNFKKRYKKLPSRIKVSCIGNLTSKEVEKCQL